MDKHEFVASTKALSKLNGVEDILTELQTVVEAARLGNHQSVV